jgi:nucleoside-diphosphate-sugar epimerase
MKLLITGASGFLGRALSLEAFRRGFKVCAAVREFAILPTYIDVVSLGDVDSSTDWFYALTGCEVVVHLAARAHVSDKIEGDSLEEFRKVNVKGTLNLARQAAASGVQRFVFISSIGVNGAETFRVPFSHLDTPAPHSPYAQSKHEAELALHKIAEESGMEVVIIRSPLIYGPDAPGNFGSLMRWLMRGVPLPLGLVNKNRRSFVALDNIIDFILICVQNPKAANQIFLVSDGEDVSTADLLRRLGSAMGKPVRLVPVPVVWLEFGAMLLGKREMFQSLCGSLQLDTSKTSRLLNWKPPVSVDEGLRRAVQQRL